VTKDKKGSTVSHLADGKGQHCLGWTGWSYRPLYYMVTCSWPTRPLRLLAHRTTSRLREMLGFQGVYRCFLCVFFQCIQVLVFCSVCFEQFLTGAQAELCQNLIITKRISICGIP
jgi:hypothetical protein